MFDGFSTAAFAWFAGLEADNTREYFRAQRPIYDDEVRGPFTELLEELAGEFGGAVKVMRQHRDLRFSRDKTPYKTRTYGHIGGEFYAELSARGLYAGTGYYAMEGDRLERYREAVASDAGAGLAEAVASTEAAGLDVEGWGLKTVPRGYPRDHPRVGLLRHKSLIAGGRLAPRRGAIGRDAALEHVAGTWRAAGPMVAWLDGHVGRG
jgi:uncharacterized protein (TIGR02453 family)